MRKIGRLLAAFGTAAEAGDLATIANVTTGDFTANSAWDSTIHATVSLLRACIAPIVFGAGPGFWLAATRG